MTHAASDLQPFFGALEIRVLEALWAQDEAQSVRDLHPHFAGIAYTTLMTTLDRLHRKGVLSREKSGRAFLYRTRCSRADLVAELAGVALGAAFGARADELRPILSFFVETVSRQDRESLAALEQLVAERRKAAKDGQPS
jgi:predicted transcriptional regulator